MRLPVIQKKGHSLIVDISAPVSYANQLGLDMSLAPNHAILAQLMSRIVSVSHIPATGLQLDANYGLPLWSTLKPDCGLILRLEADEGSDNPGLVPTLASDWGVENIKENYALASLKLWYHPQEEQALLKKQFVVEVHDYCRYQGIDLLVELFMYPLTEEEKNKQAFTDLQLTAVTEFRSACEVIGLQSPEDPLSSATLTAELDIPWLVMLNPPTYDQAKDLLRLSLENGAAGAIVGDVLWNDMYHFRRKDAGLDVTKMQDFITTNVQDRLIEMHRIIFETASFLT